jgi:hypothetical protein
MRWKDEERSDNVEDRRGMPVSRKMMGGGIGTVILVLVALYFGIDPTVVMQSVPVSGPPSVTQQQQKAGTDTMSQFVSVVLADTEKTWHDCPRCLYSRHIGTKGAMVQTWFRDRQPESVRHIQGGIFVTNLARLPLKSERKYGIKVLSAQMVGYRFFMDHS